MDALSPIIIGPCQLGSDIILAPYVVIGHPAKTTLSDTRSLSHSGGARLGNRCILRTGTVIYEDAVLGHDVQTAHGVVIRERARIGDGCVLGSGAVVREDAVLGRNVRLMESVVVCEAAQFGNDIFVGPHVTFTAGRYMTGALEAGGRMTHAEATAEEGRFWDGPPVVVEDEVRIGSNAVILAGVRLGKGCIIAAGTVVSMNVPAGVLAAGNPARLLRTQKRESR